MIEINISTMCIFFYIVLHDILTKSFKKEKNSRFHNCIIYHTQTINDLSSKKIDV